MKAGRDGLLQCAHLWCFAVLVGFVLCKLDESKEHFVHPKMFRHHDW